MILHRGEPSRERDGGDRHRESPRDSPRSRRGAKETKIDHLRLIRRGEIIFEDGSGGEITEASSRSTQRVAERLLGERATRGGLIFDLFGRREIILKERRGGEITETSLSRERRGDRGGVVENETEQPLAFREREKEKRRDERPTRVPQDPVLLPPL